MLYLLLQSKQLENLYLSAENWSSFQHLNIETAGSRQLWCQINSILKKLDWIKFT